MELIGIAQPDSGSLEHVRLGPLKMGISLSRGSIAYLRLSLRFDASRLVNGYKYSSSDEDLPPLTRFEPEISGYRANSAEPMLHTDKLCLPCSSILFGVMINQGNRGIKLPS